MYIAYLARHAPMVRLVGSLLPKPFERGQSEKDLGTRQLIGYLELTLVYI